MRSSTVKFGFILMLAVASGASRLAADGLRTWQVGTPIVTYWAGPSLSDATAEQMAEGGWNLVWCTEKELDVAHRHGLRGQLQNPLLVPESLAEPARREKLDALVARVRQHPALYSYFLTDEPNATNFTALGKLVAYLRLRDPAHLAYINLFPTYASNEQLGNPGATAVAYRAHLRQFVDGVKPGLISYDHYQFTTTGDSGQYFLNLALIRQAAQAARLPFLNIVQACSWTPSIRVPTPDEMRYLVYTTLAYGAQGISYFVYCCPGAAGGIADSNGVPTQIYGTLKTLNREFVAIGSQLQPLKSLAVYHAGMLPPGAEPLPKDARFALDPPVPRLAYQAPQPVKGVLLGCFGPASVVGKNSTPTHLVVVNLDYKGEAVVSVRGPQALEVFDPAKGTWSQAAGRAELRLAPGGGRLLREPRQ